MAQLYCLLWDHELETIEILKVAYNYEEQGIMISLDTRDVNIFQVALDEKTSNYY